MLFLEAEDPERHLPLHQFPGFRFMTACTLTPCSTSNLMCIPSVSVWPPAWALSVCWNQREARQPSTFKDHDPPTLVVRQASDIRIQADEILYLKDRLNQELSDRTGQPLDRIQQDTDRDFFMSPNEAVEYGLIDSVIDKRPVQAVG